MALLNLLLKKLLKKTPHLASQQSIINTKKKSFKYIISELSMQAPSGFEFINDIRLVSLVVGYQNTKKNPIPSIYPLMNVFFSN